MITRLGLRATACSLICLWSFAVIELIVHLLRTNPAVAQSESADNSPLSSLLTVDYVTIRTQCQFCELSTHEYLDAVQKCDAMHVQQKMSFFFSWWFVT